MHLQLHARMTPRPPAGKSTPSITQVLGQAAYTACELSKECASENTEAAPPPPPPSSASPGNETPASATSKHADETALTATARTSPASTVRGPRNHDTARPGAAITDGAIIGQAVRKKRRRYGDIHRSPHACLLVLGCERYGRWSEDATATVRELAHLKAAEAPPRLRGVAQLAWANRWWSLLGVGTHRALAEAPLRHSGVDLITQEPPAAPAQLSEVLVP